MLFVEFIIIHPRQRTGDPVCGGVPIAAAANPRDGRAVKRREESEEPETGHKDAYPFHIMSSQLEAISSDEEAPVNRMF